MSLRRAGHEVTLGYQSSQLHAFAGWDPRVLGVLERAGQVFRHGIYSRAPLPRWNVGRVTLLGDRAHAMVPFQPDGPEARARSARMAARTAANEFGPPAATWAADADRGN